MTTPGGPTLSMRLPLWNKLAGLAVLVVAVVILAGAFRQGGSTPVLAAFFLAVATLITWRTSGLAVTADPEELTIRNAMRTVRLDRSEITEFWIGTGGRAGNRMIYAGRREGRPVGLDVTTDVPLFGGKERLQRRLERLEKWRVGGPRVSP